jgi:hypothetical protein
MNIGNATINNYYYLNIKYVLDLLANSTIDCNILIKDSICHLKKIKDEIIQNTDPNLHMTLIDDFIFGIYANIYILNDIIKYHNLTTCDTITEIIKFDDKTFKYVDKNCNIILPLNDTEHRDILFIINTTNSYKATLTAFLKKTHNTIFKSYNFDSKNIFEIWRHYIKTCIIISFNTNIYINNTTDFLSFEFIHIYDEAKLNRLIDFTAITNKKILRNPFSYFNCFFNRELITTSINNNDFNIIVNYIKYLFKFTHITYNQIVEFSNPRYITIPQHQGICWFISILSGLVFSDIHKILMTKQIATQTNNYTKFIKKTIETFSAEPKKYNELTEETLDAILGYKNEPFALLKEALGEYISDANIDKTSLKIFNNVRSEFKYDFCYFISFFSRKLNFDKSSTIKDIKEKLIEYKTNEFAKDTNNFGILPSCHYSMFKYIYKTKLNLNVAYIEVKIKKKEVTEIYKIPEELITKPDEDTTIRLNNNKFNYTPNNTLEQGTDILIVSLFNQHIGDYTLDNKLKTDNTQPSIIDLSIMGTNKTITYQGIEYVLDYNILTSSKLINIINNEHLIAGIYIDNEKYICDSEDYLLNKLDIKTTCGFNRFDWNSDLLNCTNEICYNHLCEIISTTNNTVFKVKNIPHGIRFCYNNNMNRYVFIRKDLYDELKGLMVP